MQNEKDKQTVQQTPTISKVLTNGTLVELVYSKEDKKTRLAVGSGDDVALQDYVDISDDERLVRIKGSNNLIRHEILALPERPEPFGALDDLVADIEGYLDRYVDLTPGFRTVAARYALFTWVYDAFNELPYL